MEEEWGRGSSKKAIPVPLEGGASGISPHANPEGKVESGIRLEKVPLVAAEIFEDATMP